MRTILEALSKWKPPDGTIRSVTVEVADATLEHTVTVVLNRPPAAPVAFTMPIGYVESMNLPMASITYRLTDRARAACIAAEEAPGPRPARPRATAPTESGRPGPDRPTAA